MRLRQGEGPGLIGAAMLMLGLVLGLAIGMAVVGGDDTADSDAEMRPLSVAAVSNEPGEYCARRLWVAGVVGDVIGPNVFVLEGSGDDPVDELLVVTEDPLASAASSPAARPLVQDDRIWARGELAVFDQARIEQDLGLEFKDDIGARAGDPVLLAETVELTAQLYPRTGRTTSREASDRPEDFSGSR